MKKNKRRNDMSPPIADVEVLNSLIEVCKEISGANDRITVFRTTGSTIQDLIRLIYDPFQTFGVTSKTVKKFGKESLSKTILSENTVSLTQLLQVLSEKEFTGNLALQVCWNFIQTFPTFADTIYKALDKDLKIRTGVKMVNKAFPFLVPEFSCALGHPLDNYQKFFEENKSNFYVSRKLDGVRCFFVCRQGVVKAMSRSGHEYPSSIQGLPFFLEELSRLGEDFVLDGEMTVVDESGSEYFDIVNSLMNVNARKDGKRGKNTLQMTHGQKMVYQVFDKMECKTFLLQQQGLILIDRQKGLKLFCDKLRKTDNPLSKKINMLEQKSAECFQDMWKESCDKGWEGLIYRYNAVYQGKKSKHMLKRKLVFDAEYEVLEVKNEAIMCPGTTDSRDVCGHFRIAHKGFFVWVGSGLTWDQRVKYRNRESANENNGPEKTKKRKNSSNISELLGQHVTISYTEEIHTVSQSTQEESWSLRFPRLKTVHGHKRQK
jgi:ATP-dependent DNA ligase